MKIRKDPLASSKLAQTILKTNPGIDRVTREKLDAAKKLNMKKIKMSEHQRKLFINKLESRRKKRSALYNRLKPKLEPSTRSIIEKYKLESRKTPSAPLTLLKTFPSQQSQHQKGNLVSQPSVELCNLEDNPVTSCEETETQARIIRRREKLFLIWTFYVCIKQFYPTFSDN